MRGYGYLAAVVGTVAGAALGASPGIAYFFLTPCTSKGSSASGCTSSAGSLRSGGVVGGVLGCWWALRYGRYERAGPTAALLVPLLVSGAMVLGLVTNVIDRLGGAAAVALNALVSLVMLTVLPAAARWIVLRGRNLTTRQISSSSPP